MENNVKKSPFVAFLKFLLCAVLVFGAFIIGDNVGHKRGFQETADYTLERMGVDVSVNNYEEYCDVIDRYLEEGTSIENIFSPEKIGKTVGDMVTDFLDSLFGK